MRGLMITPSSIVGLGAEAVYRNDMGNQFVWILHEKDSQFLIFEYSVTELTIHIYQTLYTHHGYSVRELYSLNSQTYEYFCIPLTPRWGDLRRCRLIYDSPGKTEKNRQSDPLRG